jgi:ClpP class serine protease
MVRDSVRKLLLSKDRGLFMTSEAYREALFNVFPPTEKQYIFPLSFWDDTPSYSEITEQQAKILKAAASEEISVCSSDFDSVEIPHSMAYYYIHGCIVSEFCRWNFSSRQFEQDIIRADANPNIICHFLHIDSGGGDAYYLDRVAETLKTIIKPMFVLCDSVMCSAAYYIGCHGTKVCALTQNDVVGSIGTMISFWDWSGFFEMNGFKKIEEYSSHSDLKNKKTRDLIEGKPDQFITEVLDPYAEQFLAVIKAARPALANLPDDDPIFRGETYSGTLALEKGLIDGIITFSQAVTEAYNMGIDWEQSQPARSKISSFM